MTVAIAQARGWTDSYLVLTASQLTGLEQTYTALTRATRCTRLYGGADRILGGDVPEDWLQLRDQVKDTLPESLVRPTRKVTTLDYLDPGERRFWRSASSPRGRARPARRSGVAGPVGDGRAAPPSCPERRHLAGGLCGGRRRPWSRTGHAGGRLARQIGMCQWHRTPAGSGPLIGPDCTAVCREECNVR